MADSPLDMESETKKRAPDHGPDFGCGDHSCYVSKPTGMGTNGGCRCEPRELRRGVIWWRLAAEGNQNAVERLRDLLLNCPEAMDYYAKKYHGIERPVS